MATLLQKSRVVSVVNVGNNPIPLTFDQPVQPASTIIVLSSGWNSADAGGIIGAVTDSNGNSYQKSISVDGPGNNTYLEAYLAQNASLGGTAINAYPLIGNLTNRITLCAFEFGGIDNSTLGIIETATDRSTANTTSLALTSLGVPSVTSTLTIAAIGWHWQNTPKSAGVPAGFTLAEELQDTSGNRMGFQLVYRNHSATGNKSVSWAFAQQSQGSQGFLFSIRATAIQLQVRIPLAPLAANASDVIYQVHKEPPTSSGILGPLLFRGTLSSIPSTISPSGKVDLLIPVPPNVSVELGSTIVAIVQGVKNNIRMSNHASPGIVEVVN